MTLAAGNLRHRVRLERFGYEQDSAGDPVQNPETGELRREWQLIALVWAAIEPLSAREFIQSGASQSQVSARITLRYRSDLKATERIVHGTRVYNPAGILADRDSGLEYVTLPCSEGVGVGE